MQNNNWCFGKQAGLSFLPSYKIYNTQINSDENCAVISDRTTGKLLFYTDGVNVYDSTHGIMNNGYSVGSDISHSSGQGSLIVPFPTDTNKYYLLTLEEWSSSKSYLRYSVIDMRLNGGNGGVVVGQKAVILDSNLTEALTCINSCSQTWVVTIKKGTNDFNLIRITPSGIDTARVVSSRSYPFSGKGLIIAKFSPDVRKIAIAVNNGVSNTSYVALHDFDVSTGKVSNGIVIDTLIGNDEFYGCEFSPDSKKLFSTGIFSNKLYQYNLEYKDAASIRASRKVVATTVIKFGLPQLGPDNNIYFTIIGSQFLQKITNPNAMSPGCVVMPNGILLSSAATCFRTLPQLVRLIGEKPYIRGARTDTIICNSEYTLRAEKNHTNYLWSDSATADSLFITNSGRYTVTITDSCFQYTDTFDVVLEPALHLSLGADTSICNGISIELKNKFASQGLPLWSNGSNTPSIFVNKPGSYSLTLTYNDCKLSDTINISPLSPPIVHLGNDTTVCQKDSIQLSPGPQPPGAKFVWNTGDTTAAIKATISGYICVTVTYKDCSSADTVRIRNIPSPTLDLGNDTLLCYGKSLILPLSFVSKDSTTYLWNDGSTANNFTVHDNAFVKVKMANMCGSYTDSVNVAYRICQVWLPTAFSPNGDGLNDYFHLLGDVGNVGFFRLIVYNRWGQCVYSADDARSGWDGKYKGKDAEMGTYYYMMKLVYNGLGKVLSQTWKGDVTLIR